MQATKKKLSFTIMLTTTAARQLGQRASITTTLLRFNATSCRTFSSVNSGKSNPSPTTLLYQRDTENRSFRPRAMLTMASLHTVYWTWYVADFIPAVNEYSNADLNVDPSVGLLGLFVAASINVGTAWYGTRLVSEIALDTKDNVLLKTHALPWLRPSTGFTSHAVGTLSMDVQSVETKRVIEGETFEDAMGHLLLKDSKAPRSPYLLEVREKEVKESRKLMQILLNPTALWNEIETEDHERKRAERRKVKLNRTLRRVPAMKLREKASDQKRLQ